MPFFSSAELVDFAEMAESSMEDTFRVEVPGAWVPGPNGSGYYGPSAIASYPCRKDSPEAGERSVAGQPVLTGGAYIAVPLSVNLAEATVGEHVRKGESSGRRYSIVGPADDTYMAERRYPVVPADSVGE